MERLTWPLLGLDPGRLVDRWINRTRPVTRGGERRRGYSVLTSHLHQFTEPTRDKHEPTSGHPADMRHSACSCVVMEGDRSWTGDGSRLIRVTSPGDDIVDVSRLRLHQSPWGWAMATSGRLRPPETPSRLIHFLIRVQGSITLIHSPGALT